MARLYLVIYDDDEIIGDATRDAVMVESGLDEGPEALLERVIQGLGGLEGVAIVERAREVPGDADQG